MALPANRLLQLPTYLSLAYRNIGTLLHCYIATFTHWHIIKTWY